MSEELLLFVYLHCLLKVNILEFEVHTCICLIGLSKRMVIHLGCRQLGHLDVDCTWMKLDCFEFCQILDECICYK